MVAAKKYTGQMTPGGASQYGANTAQGGGPWTSKDSTMGGAFGYGKNTPGNYVGLYGDMTQEATMPTGSGGKGGVSSSGLTPEGLPIVSAGAFSGSAVSPAKSDFMNELKGFAKDPYAAPEDIQRRKTEADDTLSAAQMDASQRLGDYAAAMGFGSSGSIQAGQRGLAETFGALKTKAGNEVEDWAAEMERQQGRDRLSALGLGIGAENQASQLAQQASQFDQSIALDKQKLEIQRQLEGQAGKDRRRAMAWGGGGRGQEGGAVNAQSALANRPGPQIVGGGRGDPKAGKVPNSQWPTF